MALKIGPMPTIISKPVIYGIDLASGPDQSVVVIKSPVVKATEAIEGFGKAMGMFGKVKNDVQSIAQAYTKELHKPKMAQTELESQIDEMLDLERRIQEMDVTALTKKREELRKLIIAAYADADPAKEVVMTSTLGEIRLSPCSNTFKLTNTEGLFDKLGREVFVKIAKLGITDLKKVLSENELATFGKTEAGSRSIAVMPIKAVEALA